MPTRERHGTCTRATFRWLIRWPSAHRFARLSSGVSRVPSTQNCCYGICTGEEMKNALGYCRVSGRSQKDGTSLDEQEEQIDVWAHANGYTVLECFRGVVSGEK